MDHLFSNLAHRRADHHLEHQVRQQLPHLVQTQTYQNHKELLLHTDLPLMGELDRETTTLRERTEQMGHNEST